MPTWTCEWCDQKFKRDKNGGRHPIRFCSQDCYHDWSRKYGNKSTCFKKGVAPWNSGTVGVMKPNSGSFQKGRKSETRQPIGAVKIRTDKSGKQRAWVKIAENGNPYDWKLRAVVVWEKKRGVVPAGQIVHHKDRNTLNDKIGNLELMSRSRHMAEHRPEFIEKQRRNCAKATKERHARNRAARKQSSDASA